MIKIIIFLIVLTLTISTFKCSNNIFEAENNNKKTLYATPLDCVFVTDEDSIIINPSDTFIIDRNILVENAFCISYIHELYLFGDEFEISKEFIINSGDIITISITNCLVDKPWIVYYSDSNDLELIFKDSIFLQNSECNLTYQFRTTRSNKGYIGFIELGFNELLNKYTISSENKGLAIAYTCDPIDSLWIQTDSLAWIFDITQYPPLHIFLKGKTNAYSLFIELHGSGVLEDYKIPLTKSGFFCDTIYQWSTKINHTFLHVFGTVGLPKKIILKNPLSPGT